MRILLLGGNGQVGHELRRSLAPIGELVVTTRDGSLPDGRPCESLDLADLDAIGALIERVDPDAVVNAAAYTAVDRAEDEPESACRINAEAPEDRRCQVGRGHRIGCRVSTQAIARTEDGSASNTATRQKQRVTIGPVVAAPFGIDLRRPAKLAHRHDQC